jgi:plastocyanin
LRKLLVASAALIIAAVLAVPALAGKTIKIGDNYFVKPGGATVTVSNHSTVKWINKGHNTHNVFVLKGPVKFHSGSTIAPGKSFSHKLTKRGTYTIICTIHGTRQKLKLVVK